MTLDKNPLPNFLIRDSFVPITDAAAVTRHADGDTPMVVALAPDGDGQAGSMLPSIARPSESFGATHAGRGLSSEGDAGQLSALPGQELTGR